MITISGRHLTVTDAMKQHVEGKLKPVIESVPHLKITSAKVVLEMEKSRCKAEIIVNMKNHDMEAVSETYDMYQAIDMSVEKIDTQIRKLVDKVQDHHRGKVSKEADAKNEADAEAEIE
ncbi:MAG: ribosome-associated translation inhibitor RaiA [Victivallaceae bacterium]|jgi:putative sigma-54 modulation protein